MVVVINRVFFKSTQFAHLLARHIKKTTGLGRNVKLLRIRELQP